MILKSSLNTSSSTIACFKAMTSVGSSSYQEIVNDLKHKLLYTSFELESTRTVAKEETRRSEENMKQLLQLLKVTCQERDEARNQLHRALDRFSIPTSPAEIFSVVPNFQMEMNTTTLNPIEENSSFTSSENLNYGSSSPIDSSFEAAVQSSDHPSMRLADLSDMGLITNQDLNQEYDLIENLLLRKPLPQKGRLLEAVMEAGPSLHTLLVAGSLPQWRNPPPPLQSIELPFISITDCHELETTNSLLDSNPCYPFQNSLSTTIYHEDFSSTILI